MISDALQRAIFQRLTTDNVASGRVFDQVKQDEPKPYVTIGNEQTVDDSDTCRETLEVFADIHVWADRLGRTEAKSIGEAVRRSILSAPLEINGYANIEQQFRDARVFMDTDGKTAHGVMTFRFLLQPDI